MPSWNVSLRLPFISIGVNDIRIGNIRAISKGRQKEVGPYLLIARAPGLALDTGLKLDAGNRPITWTPHAQAHQLWHLRSSGVKGEALILSASNSLALDATRATGDDVVVPVMWEVHGEAWQRWRLEEAADGLGYLIQSVHSQKYLTLGDEAENAWTPWFEERHGRLSQQWIVALPHGHQPNGG
jgi:hypothetical protein